MPRKSPLVIVGVIWDHAQMSDQTAHMVHVVFNQAEAGLWFVIALVLAVRLRMPLPWRWLLPAAFAVFGVSDLIEVQTGAWWEPWWLLVMKAGCVLVFLLAWRVHRRQRRPHG